MNKAQQLDQRVAHLIHDLGINMTDADIMKQAYWIDREYELCGEVIWFSDNSTFDMRDSTVTP